MENYSLEHHGIKGQRWGIRRFQRRDGTLTAEGKKRYGDGQEESVEEKRAKLLKSTDANELYENRSLLTTNEINERLNRIDTERRLSEIADKTKKTGMDYVNKFLSVGRKVDEVYKFVNESAIGKQLKKQLGLEKEEKRLSLKEAYDKRDKLSTNKLKEVLGRARTENEIKKLLDTASKEVKETKSNVDMDEIKSYVDRMIEEMLEDKK